MKILKAAIRTLVLVGIMIAMSSVFAEESPGNVYRQQVNKPLSEVYDKVYKSLEEARFFVVFELVLYQGDFDGFSDTVVSRNKAQCAGNGISPCQVL